MPELFADRYEIQHELGRGAFGVVFLAHDTRLRDRKIALKILHPTLSNDPTTVRLFENEAGALASLEHDHIVTVYDAGVFEDRRYIAMAYVQGSSLAEVVKDQGARPPQRVADWLQQAASALAYAHGQGMLHRDIKSANLLLDEKRNRIVVTDFGLAKAAEMSGGSMSIDAHTLTGTAAYRAPEVAKDGHSRASDLYGLGVVAYELLAGQRPFLSDDPLSLLMLHATEPVPSLPSETSPYLAQLVMQLLAKDPAERPASAGEVVTAIEIGGQKEEVGDPKTEVGRGVPLRPPSEVVGGKEQVAGVESAQVRPEQSRRADQRPTADSARIHSATEVSDRRSGGGGRRWAIIIPILLLGIIGGVWLVNALWPDPPQPTPEVVEVVKEVTVEATSTLLPSTNIPVAPSSTSIPATDTPVPPTNTPIPPTNTPVPSTLIATVTPILGIGSTMISEKDGMEMVYVPAGEFLMGSPDGVGNGDEHPQHTVHLGAYWIDRTEVTNAQYQKCVDTDTCQPSLDFRSDNQPVVGVNWHDASAYCQWADRRLPTEAEWEKAARGTDSRTYPWGDSFDGNKLNYCDINCSFDWKDEGGDDGHGSTAPVENYLAGASPYGALDMAGNVWEWVSDWYESDYYSRSPDSNPTGPQSGELRVLRGGSWANNQDSVRSAERVSLVWPDDRSNVIGFRCAVSDDEVTEGKGIIEGEWPSTDSTPSSTKIAAPTSTRIPIPSTNTPIPPTPTLIPSTPIPALGIGSTMFSDVDGMEMVYVPAGEFTMGSPAGEGFDNEHPQHTVYLDAYWIDRTEVTNAMYEKCVSGGVCDSAPDYGTDFTGSNQPVVGVSWHDASAYCSWAGRRLPTEAEWEKAARGTDGRTYPWGNESPSCDFLNYWGKEGGCIGHTTDVGSYPSGVSPYGALDTAGNAWEWVGDWYGSAYYSQSPERNPTGPDTGDYRVLRGGSWDPDHGTLRSVSRYRLASDIRYGYNGFRCAAPS